MHRGIGALLLLSLAACSGSSEPAAASSEAPAPPPPAPAITPDAALLHGHTGLAGFALSGDGSTLYVSTERYTGTTTHFTEHVLDLRDTRSTPVRVREGDDGPYLSQNGVSQDGAFVLESRGDGLHLRTRDGAGDTLVPESERYWFTPLMSADGGTIAFVRDDELRVLDVGSGTLSRMALPANTSASPLAVLDAHTVLLTGSGESGTWLRRQTIGGESTDVCVGCRPDVVAREARIETDESGARTLVRGSGTTALAEASTYGLSPSGHAWAWIRSIEVREYEYQRHLFVEGVTPPVDQVLPAALGDVGTLALADDGTVVVEAAVGTGDTRQSCLVILRPSARVVACEPCDSTAEHCR